MAEVLVNLSNRHIHLSQEDVDVLFGAGYALKQFKDLKQPGQYACEEVVTIAGDKGKIERVRVLGPCRPESQCEIMQSDAIKLTTQQVPVKESGKLDGSASFEIIGPAGSINKDKGLMIAKRHIHMDPESAANFGIEDNQVVSLKVGVEGRETIFGDVVARVNKAYALEAHLDLDEGNACGIGNGTMGEIIK
ncbi:MAG: phosphate propanoyltransferase [Gammaproteobacteria bacterium]|nr:MAG: phosphate propanoyltransferase [Gammaproteobacteria bacterium]